jgi:hypothetical protein
MNKKQADNESKEKIIICMFRRAATEAQGDLHQGRQTRFKDSSHWNRLRN